MGSAVGGARQLAGSPYVPQVGSQAELDAYTAIELETRRRARLPLITSFLASFPESELRYLALRHRWRAVMDERLGPDAVIEAARDGIEAAEAFLGRRVESAAVRDAGHAAADFELEDLRANYYESMVGASRRLNDLPGIAEYTARAVEARGRAWDAYGRLVPADSVAYRRRETSHRAGQVSLLRDAMVVFRGAGALALAIDFGEQALRVEPNELLTLMVLAVAMSEIKPGESEPRSENLSPALDYASRAMARLDEATELANAALSPANRVALVSSVGSTMGWIYYHQREYAAAEAVLLTALAGVPLDSTIHLRLGLVYVETEQWADALSYLARATYLYAGQGRVSETSEARTHLERVYERVYGSLDGLEAFIAAEGAEARAAGGVEE